jgi:SagB-type dehydrogenase family enzyme
MGSLKLPEPSRDGDVSVEQAILRRCSCRSFRETSLTLGQVGQLLHAGQGMIAPDGRRRAVPSAGSTYPISLFVGVGRLSVDGLHAGVFRYVPESHSLEEVVAGDVRAELEAAALRQRFLSRAPVVVLVAANYERTTTRYGVRGRRYVAMEAGHVGQNISLQACALGLDTVMVGAFRESAVAEAFHLPEELDPLYLIPVGYASTPA